MSAPDNNTLKSTNLDDLVNKRPIKKRRLRLKKIKTEDLYKKLMNVLARETNHLLNLSILQKLEKDDAIALGNYLKLLKQLQKEDSIDLDKLSDEELEKLASKSK